MPAPQILAFLPKPVLFGLYGAVGGLLGALVFGEPIWQILKPPPPPPAQQPEPQLAVAASKELQLLLGQTNSFAVEIARAVFDDPVDITVENLPVGVTASPSRLTLDKGQTAGKVALTAAGNVYPSTTPIKVVASAKAGQKSITSETTVNLMVVAPSPPQADVFFVLDVTASMDWAINGVRDGIGSFAEKMRENKIDFRIGLLAFRDLTYDPMPMNLLLFDGQPFTNNAAAFRSQVEKLVSKGGGDIPESSLEAVDKACQQPFRKGATKVLLLITDAPPKVKPRQEEPQTEEEAKAAVLKMAEVVREKQIDSVHLVVQDFNSESNTHDYDIYKPLQYAGLSKGSGRRFDLRDTVNKGPAGFTDLINSFTSAVVEAAAANNPVKPTVADKAVAPELTTKSLQSSEKYAEGSGGRLFLMSAIWAGAIAALVCFVLLAGQHHYLRGSMPSPGAIAIGLAGGMMAGLIGGAAGQGLYRLEQVMVFQILGWLLLGGLAGVGLAFFIPNLKLVYGLIGGAMGGTAGGIGFIVISLIAGKVIGGSFGDVFGRLAGGLIVGFCIGLMVAIVEAAFRRAWLEVRFGARETITVNLGPEPVKIGGDNRMCTVWARGAAPVALRYFVRSGQVVCEDAPTRKEEVVRNGDSREVGNVTVTVRTGSGSGAGKSAKKPTAAPPLPRKVPVSQPALKPLDLDPIDEDPLPLPMSPPATSPQAAPASAVAPSPLAAPTVPQARPPVPTASKPPAPPTSAPRPAASPPALVASPPAPKPPPTPRDPDACPSCGRKNQGRPGTRYCMLCDQTY